MRQRAKKQPDSGVNVCGGFEGKESELHNQIEDELKRRRWLYIHSRTDKRTTTAKGVPDFAIFPQFSYRNRPFFVEVKTKTGKLTPEQRAFQVVAELLEYRFVVCRSFGEFLKAIE